MAAKSDLILSTVEPPADRPVSEAMKNQWTRCGLTINGYRFKAYYLSLNVFLADFVINFLNISMKK